MRSADIDSVGEDNSLCGAMAKLVKRMGRALYSTSELVPRPELNGDIDARVSVRFGGLAIA